MTRPYSDDPSLRVVGDLEEGEETQNGAAARFRVGIATVRRCWRLQRENGTFAEVKAYCTEKWDAGDSLLVLGHGGGSWFAVTEANRRGSESWVHVKRETAAEKLAAIRASGRYNCAVHADDDGWLVVSRERPDWGT